MAKNINNAPLSISQEFRLASIFSDNMVLQHGVRAPVWGVSSPGDRITVRFAGQTRTALAGNDSRWKLFLYPMEISAIPRTMTICSSLQKMTVELRNVLVGDVWLCSGQSNMEFCVAESMDADREIREANYPKIRLFAVPKIADLFPGAPVSAPWLPCDSRSVRDFSAIGYFFGREIQRKTGIPVGLIDNAWCGTCAEAWTSREALMSVPFFSKIFADYEREIADPEKMRKIYALRLKRWTEKYDRKDTRNGGESRGWHKPGTNDSKWAKMELPRSWQDSGHNFSGVFWFRREVEIPAGWKGKDIVISLGALDKSDVSYFNGVRIGGITMQERPDAWSTPRIYTVPGKIVKAGRNLIAVRVFSNIYEGGFIGKAEEMSIRTTGRGVTESIPLNGIWKFAVEANFGFVPPPPGPKFGHGNPNSPHILFDNMIRPLLPFGIRGAIWYQGEANADRAIEYRKLFPLMIRSWRKAWKLGNFPFYFVQLANHNPVKRYQHENPWAELREAQSMALSEPSTEMAVAIDVGEADDVHPKNKQTVAYRLSLPALTKDYGFKNLVFSGPIYKSMEIIDKKIRIYFSHVGAGLLTHGNSLSGFSISGKDRNFVPADAEIEESGETILVSSAQIEKPVAVRYGWANNPLCNLYNSSDLPASPFRTDNFPRVKR